MSSNFDLKKNYTQFSTCNEIVSLRNFIVYELNEINKIDPQIKIIVLLDSLDKLNPKDFKQVEKWLITDLPQFVKFIVSTVPDHGHLLQLITRLIHKKYDENLKLKFKKEESDLDVSLDEKLNKLIDKQTLHVNELNPVQAENILKIWLENAKRKLTDDQWSHLREIFEQSRLLLLFLKLAFDIVINWSSTHKPDAEFLQCRKSEDIIIYMFKRMERKHGDVIFKRAVCYMTICKMGISDNELEDILSLDEDVLFSVFQFHVPPIRRFPTSLWVRIKKDVEQYIVEKEANDTKVIRWHHKKFIEVSIDYYVKMLSQNEYVSLNKNLIEFYDETWLNKPKPYQLNEYLRKKLHKKNSSDVAERFLTPQPIKYIAVDGKTHYNKRKLNELPHCLSNISHTDYGIQKACELVFYNYDFMHAKFLNDSLNEIKDDLRKILIEAQKIEENSSLKELELYDKCLNLCGSLISDYPDTLAYQLCSRLLNHYEIKFPHVKKFIDECDLKSPKLCCLISPCMQQQSPGSFLISSIQKHNEPIFKLILLNKFLITYSTSLINVYAIKKNPNLDFIFNVSVPSNENIRNFLNNSKFKFMKKSSSSIDSDEKKEDYRPVKILNKANLTNEFINFKVISNNVMNDKNLEQNLESKSNPDLFPALFLIVNKYNTFIIEANKKIKFAYEISIQNCRSGCQILDVFCLNMNKVLVVEKNSYTVKIFSDFELDPYKYKEYMPSRESNPLKIINCATSNHSYIDGLFYSNNIDLIIHFENNEIKLFSIRHSKEKLESKEGKLVTNLNNNLYVSVLCSIKEPSVDDISIIKAKDNFLDLMNDKKNPNQFRIGSDLYLSDESLTFTIIKKKDNKKMCPFIFVNFTKQKVIDVKPSPDFSNDSSLFNGALITQDYVYIVHSDKFSNSDRSESNHKSLCKYEINNRVDLIEMISKDLYILCRKGIIEMFKMKCLNDSHKVELVFAINSLSTRINDIVMLGKIFN
jgi:hypothetical protein